MVIVALLSICGLSAADMRIAEKITELSTEKAYGMIGEENVIFIDVRNASYYGTGHLPGAISAPFKWTSSGKITSRTGEFDMSRLPGNKDEVLVFYSYGPTSLKSYAAYKASVTALEAGYRNVLFLKSGYTGWRQSGYPFVK
jgi:rhodanese-related sulfurtransferase